MREPQSEIDIATFIKLEARKPLNQQKPYTTDGLRNAVIERFGHSIQHREVKEIAMKMNFKLMETTHNETI